MVTILKTRPRFFRRPVILFLRFLWQFLRNYRQKSNLPDDCGSISANLRLQNQVTARKSAEQILLFVACGGGQNTCGQVQNQLQEA